MRRDARLLVVLAALVAALALASLLTGPAGAGPRAGLQALWTGEGPLGIVLREIRAPRTVLAIMVGASLGLSGAALQGYLRNPLAEPGLIGISASAALGAVIAIQAGVSALALGVPFAALGGALGGVALILGLAGRRAGGLGLILGGIAVSALAGALTALVLNLSPNPFAAYDIMFWTMGSLADRSWGHVLTAAPLMLAGWLALARTGRDLDALSLGEEAAASMGVNLPRLRLAVVLGSAAAVGAATAVVGAIGFVGLVVPHLLRGAVGAMPSRLLPASGLGGAALVLAADVAVRMILPERDLKLGVMMALVGAPVFLHLIWRTQAGR
ncbi:FecCD family ABC transporter permease [Paracoccus salipaludis]|uniref:ABC transporter permease n=1 Tax=Paracoccus salipaludis TaxID=2032623 RepID=A0A2A2GP51_9RHOB|nr:iron ABC transporter permease [Paracoccus salipaludis]PAU98675.1 ABC transporter permease [Paracoccus salipaludis]